MHKLVLPLFSLALVTTSFASSARAQDDGPNECTTWRCFGFFCEVNAKEQGTSCGGDDSHECDGNGSCVEKELCGNGHWDYDGGEACDQSSDEWANSAGACNSRCELTRDVYGACPHGGQPCWDGGKGWFCSALGACTRLCAQNADCGGGGRCVEDPIDDSQHICALPNCGPGTTHQWVGRQGCFEGSDESVCDGAPTPNHDLCGWLSADPTTHKLWCPGEVDRCCPPEQFGGATSDFGCVEH